MIYKNLFKKYDTIIVRFVTIATFKELGEITYKRSDLPNLPSKGNHCFLNGKEYLIKDWYNQGVINAGMAIVSYYVETVEKNDDDNK